MKRLIHLLRVFWLLAFAIGCNNDHEAKKDIPEPPAAESEAQTPGITISTSSLSDTLVVDRQAAVFIEPDSLKIADRKKEVGEDFYAGADDYIYYMHTAREFLDTSGIPLLYTTGKNYIRFVRSDGSSNTISLQKLPELWSIYFFHPGKKEKRVDMTMIEEEYHSYFNK